MLSDPIIPLTIVTVLAWSAVIGWKLRRREPAYGVNRRPEYGPRGLPRGPRWEDDEREWDEEPPARGGRSRYEASRDESARNRSSRYESSRDAASRYEAEPPRRPLPGVTRPDHAEVEINPGKCMRFAFCEHEAPGIFKLVGDRIDYKPHVPAEHVDAAEMAAKVCPARAIKIKMPGTRPYLPQPPVDDDERRPMRR